MARLIEILGGKLFTVMIDKINPEGYFEAKAILLHNEEKIELPIRPSDGLCLALLSGVPYLVAEEVLSKKEAMDKTPPPWEEYKV